MSDFDHASSRADARRRSDPDGATVTPERAPDAVSQVRARALQYHPVRRRSCHRGERASRSLRRRPDLCAGQAAVERTHGTTPSVREASPATGLRLSPAADVAPPAPVDNRRGRRRAMRRPRPTMRSGAEVLGAARRRRREYKAPIYPGYPWRDRRAAGDPNATAPAPAPPVPGTVPTGASADPAEETEDQGRERLWSSTDAGQGQRRLHERAGRARPGRACRLGRQSASSRARSA
jgi:hypothetical protein